ncbi:MAG TPA: TlpA disulfide reductase family protein [Pyrinomonadaceae bacterium]
MRLFRTLLTVGLIVLLSSFAVPAQRKGSTAKRSTAVKTKVAPLKTDDLKALLAKPKDKPLLINFWATWCDPCRDEFPDLVKLDKDYRPHSINFVTVSLDEAKYINSSVPKFLTTMKATMPAYLLDANDPEPAINAVDQRWQGDLPATFLFNTQGELIYKHFGRVDIAELRGQLNKLVKK